jgi:hypothetical protein
LSTYTSPGFISIIVNTGARSHPCPPRQVNGSDILCPNTSVVQKHVDHPDSPCSVGAIVPASMFMYGSILIAVTLRPAVLSRRPVLEAITPLPIPLQQALVDRHISPSSSFPFPPGSHVRRKDTYEMTPPATRMYLTMARSCDRQSAPNTQQPTRDRSESHLDIRRRHVCGAVKHKSSASASSSGCGRGLRQARAAVCQGETGYGEAGYERADRRSWRSLPTAGGGGAAEERGRLVI